nr:uncharacterized protein LOC107389425 isoform X2 [Nothobranchius furzeri]
MSPGQSLREFISKRLSTAAEEILSEFVKTIVRYEEEIDRHRRLLDISWKPQISLHRIELPLPAPYVRKDEDALTHQLWNQETSSSLNQKCPESLLIKAEQDEADPLQILEQEELCISRDEEQFVLKQETATPLVTPTDEERNHSEPEPNRNQLLFLTFPGAEIQQQKENRNEKVEQSQGSPQTRDHREDVDRSELQRRRKTHSDM